MNKLILTITLTFLLSFSTSAALGFTFKISGNIFNASNSIVQYGTSSKTNFYVSFRGKVCDVNDKPLNPYGPDSIFYDTIKTFVANGVSSAKTLTHTITAGDYWTGVITIHNKAYWLLDLKDSLVDSLVYICKHWPLSMMGSGALEKPPSISITTPPNSYIKTPIIFQWITKDTVAVTAQSIWISHSGRPFTRLDTLSPTSSTYSWTPTSTDIGRVNFKICAWNADTFNNVASDSFNISAPLPTVSITNTSLIAYIGTPQQITWTSTVPAGIQYQYIKIGNSTSVQLSRTALSYAWNPSAFGIDSVTLTVTDSLGKMTKTAKAFIVLSFYDSLRITTGNSQVIKNLNLLTGQSTSLQVQGRRIDNNQWVCLKADWSITNGVRTSKIPANDSVWTFSPIDTGSGLICVYLGGSVPDTISFHFTSPPPVAINTGNKIYAEKAIKINGQTIFHLTSFDKDVYHLTVLNLQGRLIYQTLLNNSNIKIPCSGECLIQISNINNTYRSKIFIK